MLPEIWGSHGFERLLPDGTRHSNSLTHIIERDLLRYVKAFTDCGIIKFCEKKSSGIAVHWRGLNINEIAHISEKVLKISNEIKNEFIVVSDFDGGKEIRVKGVDKGTAVKVVLSEAVDGGIVAYLGDDLTDEDAFRQLGQSGLKVLVRDELRETLADLWLKPPADLIFFLEQWLKHSAVKKPA